LNYAHAPVVAKTVVAHGPAHYAAPAYAPYTTYAAHATPLAYGYEKSPIWH
jgi:hypothetical protein